ncbi:MAG: hypothetical protein WC942_09605 [Clostridia bacterium]|jgi:hypothetical protein
MSTVISKILGIVCDVDSSTLGFDMNDRVKVVVETDKDFEYTVGSVNSDTFKNLGGGDLVNIFMPFATSSSSLPSFSSGIPTSGTFATTGDPNIIDMLPFYFSNTPVVSSNLYMADHKDAYSDILSGEKSDRQVYNRTSSDIRGVGLRLPVMCVGWGYDTEGKPIPAGTGENKFAGEKDHGYQVDPQQYIAAPLDVRYNRERHVWEASGTDIDVAVFRIISVVDDNNIISVRQVLDENGGIIDDPDATDNYTLRKIYTETTYSPDDIVTALRQQSYEHKISSWLIIASSSSALPAGAGQYKVLQLDGSNDPVWDYVRAHS